MKRYIIAIIMAFITISAGAQVKAEAKTQNVFGRNVGYYITMKNTGKKSVDGVKWTAYFYDNFGDLKGTREGQWQSGNIISPIEPGEDTEDLETVWVKGATKVKITITKVHYTK